jgi:hypothetical protein
MERVQALNIDVITGSVSPMPKLKDAGDDLLWVQFESASHFNDVKTREQARPVFEMMDYVKIIVPGDQSSIVYRPVRDSDKERWPTQWAAYVNGKEQQAGYPLSEAPFLSKSQVDELLYFKVQTVEQLAGASDSVCQKFMGLNQLREKAKIYLEQLRGEEPNLRLQAEISKRDEENAALKAQLEQLSQAVAELQSRKSRKGQREEVDA